VAVSAERFEKKRLRGRPQTGNWRRCSWFLESKAKEHLHDIWMAPGIEEAEKNFDVFIELYGAKYPKATRMP